MKKYVNFSSVSRQPFTPMEYKNAVKQYGNDKEIYLDDLTTISAEKFIPELFPTNPLSLSKFRFDILYSLFF